MLEKLAGPKLEKLAGPKEKGKNRQKSSGKIAFKAAATSRVLVITCSHPLVAAIDVDPGSN